MILRTATALLAIGLLASGCSTYEKYFPDFSSSDGASDDVASDEPVDQDALNDAQADYEEEGYTLLASTDSMRVMSYSGPINDSVECLSPRAENYRIMPTSRRDRNGIEQRFRLDQRVEITPGGGLFSRTDRESFSVLSATIHGSAASEASRIEVISFDSDGETGMLKSGLRCRAR